MVKYRTTASVALLAVFGTMFASVPASAAATTPAVRLSGELVQVADQQGAGLAAIRLADGAHVPITAESVKDIASGSTVTLDVTVPADVRVAAAANRTLTTPGVDGKQIAVRLRASDLAAASDGSPEGLTSAIGKATVAEAMAPGTPALEVSTVVAAAADPVSTYTPATRKVYVAVVTPRGTTPGPPVDQARIRAQVAGASSYWSAVTGGGLTLSVATISGQYTSLYNCNEYAQMWTEAAKRVGFTDAPNTSLVIELPEGINQNPATNCSYGLGSVGTGPNDSGVVYVADDVWPVLAHELGHNMSMKHADALLCPTAADSAYSTTSGWTGTGCEEDDYGDGQDIMSASRSNFAPFLSAPQSLRTGIIPPSAATVISTVGTHSVTLLPLAGRTGVRAAEVVNPNTGVTYYVEYRTPAAPDTLNVFGVKNGVRVLRYKPGPGGGETVLLDPSFSGQSHDPDPTLPVGPTFTSYDGGVSISTVSATPSNALVTVTVSLVGFTGKAPTRVLDTRDGTGTGGSKASLGAGKSLTLTVPGMPAGTTAVALNVTANKPTAASYLTVYPGGSTRPTASNLNYLAGQTVPNLVMVPLGPGNTVTFYNAVGNVNVIADLVGYYAPRTGGVFTGQAPTRVLDTRDGTGTGAPNVSLGAGQTLTLTVPGLPAGATAVALNVTVAHPTTASYVTVYPGGTARPTASNLNFVAGQTIPNLVLVPLGPGNTVTFYNEAGTVNVIADLVGYYAPGTGAGFTGTVPARVLDTRIGTGATKAMLGAGRYLTLTVPGVPAGATAVALNVTVTGPTAKSYLTVYPGGSAKPTASNLNYVPGRTIPNLVLVPLGAGGKVNFYNEAGNVHVIADLVGYYRF